MKVGLTFDLREEYLARGLGEEDTAEFDAPETIDALDGTLAAMGFSVERIGNLEQLLPRLLAGERWDWVFNIAEGLHGAGREAQVPAILDAYEIPYVFSDTVILGLCLDKALSKHVAHDQGVPTAPFAVAEQEDDLPAIRLPLPLFVKPIAEGTGKGIGPSSCVRHHGELLLACREVWARFHQPALVEPFLPGREFTVGITGTGERASVIGVMEVLLNEFAEANGYGFKNKEHYEGRVEYRLATDAEAEAAAATAVAAWRALRCRDGGRVDLRSNRAGEPQFMEVNPLAGLHPVRSDLVIMARLAGIDYRSLIARIVESCLARIREGAPSAAAEDAAAEDRAALRVPAPTEGLDVGASEAGTTERGRILASSGSSRAAARLVRSHS